MNEILETTKAIFSTFANGYFSLDSEGGILLACSGILALIGLGIGIYKRFFP